MSEQREILALLELERDEEQEFAARLTAAERTQQGTSEQPSAKDYFAHAVSGRQQMLCALVAARTGGKPDASHNASDVFKANANRPFEDLALDASQVAADLNAEVEQLDSTSLDSSPEWISDATLADEIIQQAVTHALVHLFEPLCARGDTDQALETQLRFVDALPRDTGVLQRSRALYNLGCLYLRAGRPDDAVRAITDATQLRPALIEHARRDPDLKSIADRLP